MINAASITTNLLENIDAKGHTTAQKTVIAKIPIRPPAASLAYDLRETEPSVLVIIGIMMKGRSIRAYHTGMTRIIVGKVVAKNMATSTMGVPIAMIRMKPRTDQ
jgi:hypothetical protein